MVEVLTFLPHHAWCAKLIHLCPGLLRGEDKEGF